MRELGAQRDQRAHDAIWTHLRPNEDLTGLMLAGFRRHGWVKQCAIGTTRARMIIVPLHRDGTAKGPMREVPRESVLRWKVKAITTESGAHLGNELRFKTAAGTFKVNPLMMLGASTAQNNNCVFDFLASTGTSRPSLSGVAGLRARFGPKASRSR